MKTEKELNYNNMQITTTIEESLPELSKYIDEMPIKISDPVGSEIKIQNLKDYNESLDALLKKYAKDHIRETNKYQTISYNTSI